MHIFEGKVDEVEDCVMYLTEELFSILNSA